MEGVDFSGKTTLAQKIKELLVKQHYRVKLLHDPKGSSHAKLIWETILTLKKQGGNVATEFFLFLAARNELIHQEALVEDVDVVIFDRFIFSTVAYQLTHKPDTWELFLKIHRSFSGLMPDLCIYCDIDFHTFEQRSQHRGKKDAFDALSQDQFKAIQQAYEAVLNLQWCPDFRIHTSYDMTQVMEAVFNYLSLK